MAKEIYSDIDLAFVAHPIKGTINRKVNREAVRQSVKSLVLTNFFERPFQSDIGCGIHQYLFENFSPIIKQQIEAAAREVIRNYEPRANVIEVLAEDRPASNSLTISIAFMINTDPNPVTLQLLVERIR